MVGWVAERMVGWEGRWMVGCEGEWIHNIFNCHGDPLLSDYIKLTSRRLSEVNAFFIHLSRFKLVIYDHCLIWSYSTTCCISPVFFEHDFSLQMKHTRDNALPPTPNTIHHHGMVPSGSWLFRYEDYVHMNIFLSYFKVGTFYIPLNYLS